MKLSCINRTTHVSTYGEYSLQFYHYKPDSIWLVHYIIWSWTNKIMWLWLKYQNESFIMYINWKSGYKRAFIDNTKTMMKSWWNLLSIGDIGIAFLQVFHSILAVLIQYLVAYRFPIHTTNGNCQCSINVLQWIERRMSILHANYQYLAAAFMQWPCVWRPEAYCWINYYVLIITSVPINHVVSSQRWSEIIIAVPE